MREQESEEQLLNRSFAQIENEIVQLLNAARRAVDKAYGVKGYNSTHSELVQASLLAMIENVKLDVLDEGFRTIVQLLDDPNEALAIKANS